MKKHDFKKLSALLMAVSMMLCSVGCSETEAETEPDTEQTPITESADSSNSDTDDLMLFEITDWSFEDIANNIYVDNIQLKLPCALNELPDGFTVEKDMTGNDIFYYNSDEIGSVTIENDTIVKYFFNNETALKHNHNIIAGKIKPADTLETIIQNYGESNDKWAADNDVESMHTYRFNNGVIVISEFGENIDEFTDNETYTHIAVSIKE